MRDVRLKREAAEDGLQIIDRARLAEEAYDSAASITWRAMSRRRCFNLKIALNERPTYLEALRLRERIIAETDPEPASRRSTPLSVRKSVSRTPKAGSDGKRPSGRWKETHAARRAGGVGVRGQGSNNLERRGVAVAALATAVLAELQGSGIGVGWCSPDHRAAPRQRTAWGLWA